MIVSYRILLSLDIQTVCFRYCSIPYLELVSRIFAGSTQVRYSAKKHSNPNLHLSLSSNTHLPSISSRATTASSTQLFPLPRSAVAYAAKLLIPSSPSPSKFPISIISRSPTGIHHFTLCLKSRVHTFPSPLPAQPITTPRLPLTHRSLEPPNQCAENRGCSRHLQPKSSPSPNKCKYHASLPPLLPIFCEDQGVRFWKIIG